MLVVHQLDRPLQAGEGEQATEHRVRVGELQRAARSLGLARHLDDRAQAARVDELEVVEVDDQVAGVVEVRDGAFEPGDGRAI